MKFSQLAEDYFCCDVATHFAGTITIQVVRKLHCVITAELASLNVTCVTSK